MKSYRGLINFKGVSSSWGTGKTRKDVTINVHENEKSKFLFWTYFSYKRYYYLYYINTNWILIEHQKIKNTFITLKPDLKSGAFERTWQPSHNEIIIKEPGELLQKSL